MDKTIKQANGDGLRMQLVPWKDFYVLEDTDLKGRGLFAAKNFAKGESLYVFDYWSEEIMPMHLTNHSCDPNGRFDDRGMLIALRDIEKGDEITFNYLLHPIPASPWNFECRCNSRNCIGWISVESSY